MLFSTFRRIVAPSFKGKYFSNVTKLIVNEEIKHPQVRLALKDSEGKSTSQILPIEKAIEMAKSINLDLVLVSENSTPPVCKFENLRELFKTQVEKEREPKVSKTKALKEIHMKIGIDKHDIITKAKKGVEFLRTQHQVKVLIIVPKRSKITRSMEDTFMDFLPHIENYASRIETRTVPFDLLEQRKEYILHPKKAEEIEQMEKSSNPLAPSAKDSKKAAPKPKV